jgi:HEAT repeat protein
MGFTSHRTRKVEDLTHRRDAAGLIEAAGSADTQIGQAAISGLAEIGRAEAAPAAVRALRHRSDRVRSAAIRALCHWGEAIPLAEAVAWLPPEGASRTLALAAIAQLGESGSAPTLARSLIYGTGQEGLWETEVELVWSLCWSTGAGDARDRVMDMLLEALEDDREEVSCRAEDFLLWIGEDAAPAVAALARSSPVPDRAVWVLGQIGGASALEPLIEAVDHRDARTREEACVALGELRDPLSLEPLLRATRDTEHIVRVKAADALDRFGAVAVIAALSAPLLAVRGALPDTDNPPTVGSVTSQRRLARPAQNGSTARAQSSSRARP